MKTITHIVQIFLDIERPSRNKYNLDLTEEWVKYRIELFNKFTLPSLLNQTFQNFRIFLICGNKHKKLTSAHKWNKRIELCYGKGRSGTITTAPGYDKPGLRIEEFGKINTDYGAITRLDSDDMLHREAMMDVHNNVRLSNKMDILIFRKYLYWDRVNRYVVPVHHKPSPPFIIHIFPKNIYKDYDKFASLHFIHHRFTGGRLSSVTELPANRICVINHQQNISRVKRNKKLNVLTLAERKTLGVNSDAYILDKSRMLGILRDFCINPEDIDGDGEIKAKDSLRSINETVDIIFTTHNHSEMSVKCLNALQKYTHTPYRLIWIDNGSFSDEYKKIKNKVDNFEHISHRFETNRFYARAVNQGFILSNANYIVALSNDVVLTDNWLSKCITLMQKDSKIGLLSPLTDKIGTAGPKAEAAIKRYNLPIDGQPPKNINKLPDRYGDYQGDISMFCAVVRREVIEKIGMLDERFFILGNDNDYCDRVRTAGFKTGVCLNCFVQHEHGATKNEIFKVGSPERVAIKRDHQALLREKRQLRAMTGRLD